MRRNAAALPQVRIRMSLRALLHALPQNHCSILFLCKARYYRHIHALLQRENMSLRLPQSAEHFSHGLIDDVLYVATLADTMFDD